jgi:hypothetical protein
VDAVAFTCASILPADVLIKRNLLLDTICQLVTCHLQVLGSYQHLAHSERVSFSNVERVS